MTARDELAAWAELQLSPEDQAENSSRKKISCKHTKFSPQDECSSVSVKLAKSEDFVEAS